MVWCVVLRRFFFFLDRFFDPSLFLFSRENKKKEAFLFFLFRSQFFSVFLKKVFLSFSKEEERSKKVEEREKGRKGGDGKR